MRLHIKNRRTIILAIIFLSLILFISLFYNSKQNCSPDKSFLQAAGYLNNWQLGKAEKKLSKTFSDAPINNKTANLYLKILIYEGKLYSAQQFLWKYFSNNSLEMPQINLKKGLTYFHLGKIDSSLIAAQAALETGLRINNASIISQANNILGRIMFYKADYGSAFVYQKSALKYASENNLGNEKANALRQLGVLYWYKGKLDSALNNYYNPALKIYREIDNKVGEATTLSNIGLLYFNWKDWKQKFAYNIKALSIRKRIGDRIGLSDSYSFLSYLPLFNRTMKSTRYKLLKKSYDLSGKIGYAWGKEVAGRSLEFFFTDNLNGRTASINPDSITPDSLNYTSGEGKMFLLLRKLFAFKNNNQIDSLAHTYKAITEYADSLNYEVFKFSSLCGYASILIKQNKLLEAETTVRKALSLTYTAGKRKYDYHYANRLLSAIYFNKGELIKSYNILKNLTSYYDSLYISQLNNNPSIIGYESAISETYSSRSLSYELLSDVLIKLKKYALLFSTIESEKRLSLWQTPQSIINNSGYSHSNFTDALLQYIDSENTSEQENSLINEFGKLINGKIRQQKKILGLSKTVSQTLPVKLKTFQNSLDDNSVFLEYAFGSNSLFCYTITKNDIFVKRLNLSEKKLNDYILFFRKSIARGKWNPNDTMWKAPSLNLYKLLIESLNNNAVIKKHKNIIISPTRSLNLLPFAALIKSSNNNELNYLIRDKVLSITNSSEGYYWRQLQSISNVNSLLALSPNPDNLSFSKNEILEIPKTLFNQSKLLIGKNATLNNFLQNILTSDVIHFAGHASINNINPFYSKLNFSDGDLELFQILKYRIPAKLIILSACESGIGLGTVNNLPTDIDLVSFPRAWITTGAKSVISTQWLVEDKSSYLLMKKFYKSLLLNKDKNILDFAAALTDAQFSIATSQETKQYSHPFYWAEFYLTN